MALTTTDLTFSLAAFLLSLAVTAETIIVVLVRFDLTAAGSYTGLQRASYATVTTIIASGITAFITSQIRKLWVADVDHHFFHELQHGGTNKVERKWQTVLSVGKMSDMFRFWKIQLTYLTAALVTTSIVASLAPTLDTKEVRYDAVVSLGLPWRCATVSDVEDSRYSVYEWQLDNGSYLASGGNWAACPSRWAVTLMGGINFLNASLYAYSDLGVAVKSSAIGAPISIFGRDPVTQMGQSFVDFIQTYGSNLLATTQCVRVMVANPISCHKGGQVSWESGQDVPITATSDDGLCEATSYGTSEDPRTGNLMAKRICAHGQPGQATIVLGGIGAFARWLAVAVNDPDRPFEDEDVEPGYWYAITCDVDARDVFRYREVTLSLQDSQQTQQTSLGRQLTAGDEDCKVFDQDQNLGVFGAAVSANWQDLMQNDGIDGWFDSINQMTIDFSGRQARQAPYAFNNSKNALEDTLGLVAALATSRLNGTSELVPGTAVIANTRIGSGSVRGLMYVIPPTLAAVILAVLLFHTMSSHSSKFSCVKFDDLSLAVGTGSRAVSWNR